MVVFSIFRHSSPLDRRATVLQKKSRSMNEVKDMVLVLNGRLRSSPDAGSCCKEDV